MFVTAILAALLGAMMGSFINMAVWRTREGKAWTGRSKCVHCGMVIAARDLIPIVSFFLLGRRCRSCRKPISWQYPIVEAVTALLFVLALLRYTSGFAFPEFFSPLEWLVFAIRDWILISFLVALSAYDVRYMELPDRFTLPGAVAALLFNLFLGADWRLLVLGGLTIAGFFLAQAVFSKGRWVGDGDVRLGLLMGFALGLYEGLAALLVAYVAGALVGIVLVVRKKVKMDTMIPFGVFLSAATVAMLLAGPLVIDWYIGLAT